MTGAIFAGQIALAFEAACCQELGAPKPGNVHVFAPGRKSVAAFLRSAAAAAPFVSMPQARVGERIGRAVAATLATVGTNTNLGIILLCAPLAAAAHLQPRDLRAGVHQVLADLNREDADLTFRAIATAAPGGLGRAEHHDVGAPASVSLRDAMQAAADRDRIARQYVTDFADVLSFGEAALATAHGRWSDRKWITLALFLAFVSAFEDTHIVREHGAAVAGEVRQAAAVFAEALLRGRDPQALLPGLLAWDAALKQRSINPGTSADLTVATLFAHRLRSILPSARNNG